GQLARRRAAEVEADHHGRMRSHSAGQTILVLGLGEASFNSCRAVVSGGIFRRAETGAPMDSPRETGEGSRCPQASVWRAAELEGEPKSGPLDSAAGGLGEGDRGRARLRLRGLRASEG